MHAVNMKMKKEPTGRQPLVIAYQASTANLYPATFPGLSRPLVHSEIVLPQLSSIYGKSQRSKHFSGSFPQRNFKGGNFLARTFPNKTVVGFHDEELVEVFELFRSKIDQLRRS